MMRDFLENYDHAIDLDNQSYNQHFPDSISRSDFLLFDYQVVCEFKEVQNIQVSSQVEKLSQKSDLPEKDVKRSLYNSIEKALSKANKQIKATKAALDLPDALGLVVLENQIANDLSILSLIDAVNRKMMNPGGLANVECVLCLDFINTFTDSTGQVVRPAQTVVRNSQRAEKLSDLVGRLMRDFCHTSDTPLLQDWTMERGNQDWLTDNDGKYKKYSAKVDFKPSANYVESSVIQKISSLIDRYWWVTPLLLFFYSWLTR